MMKLSIIDDCDKETSNEYRTDKVQQHTTAVPNL